MAKIERKTVFELAPDEKTWFAFSNLGIAGFIDQIQDEGGSALINSETGEVVEISDLRQVYGVLDYLLEGNLEIFYD